MSNRFPLLSRILHWVLAVLILTMLFIGIAMVASLSDYHRLVAIHKPLGILILVLVAIRLINRLLNPPPPLPAGMPGFLRFAAHASHWLLYILMFALPLVGWGMLAAEARTCRPFCRTMWRYTPICARSIRFWHSCCLEHLSHISARR